MVYNDDNYNTRKKHGTFHALNLYWYTRICVFTVSQSTMKTPTREWTQRKKLWDSQRRCDHVSDSFWGAFSSWDYLRVLLTLWLFTRLRWCQFCKRRHQPCCLFITNGGIRGHCSQYTNESLAKNPGRYLMLHLGVHCHLGTCAISNQGIWSHHLCQDVWQLYSRYLYCFPSPTRLW